MTPDDILVGISAGERIVAGSFFRLTFAPASRFTPTDFTNDIGAVFNRLDAASGLALPVSTLDMLPGQKAAVFDVLVRPAAIGLSAAQLANYFDDLVFFVSLTSMTLVDVSAVQSGERERSNLQEMLSEAEKTKNPLASIANYGSTFKWIGLAIIAIALLYLGIRAAEAVRRK